MPYRVHTSPPLVPLLIQMNPLHTLSSHFIVSELYSILPSTPLSSKLYFSFRLYICISPLPPSLSLSLSLLCVHLAPPITISWIAPIICRSTLYSPFHHALTSSLLGPNIVLNTHFLKILSLCSSLNVRDKTPPKKKIEFLNLIVLKAWREGEKWPMRLFY